MASEIYRNERLGLYVTAFTGPETMGKDRRMYQITVSAISGTVRLNQQQFELFLETLAPESDDA